jgi:hypothetical protein
LTEKKGYGLRVEADIPKYVRLSDSDIGLTLFAYRRDAFIYEYVGDVVNPTSFKRRMREYAEEGIQHFYFMMLQKDEVCLIPGFDHRLFLPFSLSSLLMLRRMEGLGDLPITAAILIAMLPSGLLGLMFGWEFLRSGTSSYMRN